MMFEGSSNPRIDKDTLLIYLESLLSQQNFKCMEEQRLVIWFICMITGKLQNDSQHLFFMGLINVYGIMLSQSKYMKMFMHVVVQPYLKVGKLGMVEVRVDVQSGSHHQQRFKLVQRGADVASEA